MGAAVWRSRTPAWARGPKLRDGHPILRLPVRAGMVVLCQQGNSSMPGHTHSGGNCLYALDLSNCAENVVDVVAAAPGRVSVVYGAAKPGDTSAGLRFGNQVKVEHGEGYYTFYSHLDKMAVREGDIVRNGDPLGTMGSTGAAGNRHLHFSLHHGESAGLGVPDSFPMRSLITANLTRNFVFQSTPSNEIIGGESDLWSGRMYGSENAPNAYIVDGRAADRLLDELGMAYDRLRLIVDHRILLDEVARVWEQHDSHWARKTLAPILERTPRHALARYWFGTAVYMVAQQWAEAEQIFEDLLAQGMVEPTWEMWLLSWIHNRLGIIANARKQPDAAIEHFQNALRLATARPEHEFARDNLKSLGKND